MKKTIKLITTMFLAITLLVSCIPYSVQAASTTKVAKTQKQLEKLLSDKNAKVIEINTTKKITITIPKGSFNKKIVINAPKASVVNSGKMNGITVNNLTKFTEKTKGNSLSIKDSKLTLNVTKSAELKNLVVSNKKADIKVVADGNVKNMTVNSAKSVDIKGDHKKPINVNSNAEGVIIKANSSVNVTMNKNGNLVVNVENVKVIAGKDDVVTKITNNTEITIVIVDKNDDVVGEVESDETSKVTNDKNNEKDKNDSNADNDKNTNDNADKNKDEKNDEDKDKNVDKKDDKNNDKDKTDKKEDSSNQDTNNSSSNSGSTSIGGGLSVITPPIKPSVTDNYSITITSAPSVVYTNRSEIVEYELKNNSTKVNSIPSSYRINTVTSGCSVIASSFGSIAVSASAISSNASIRIELLDKNDNVVTSQTATFETQRVNNPVYIPSFNLSELNNGYQIKFTYWNDSNNFFNTFTEHKHYAYISSVEDNAISLESADWQVAVANNKNQNDESLVWNDLSNTVAISGVADSTYYENGQKLTFNSTGTYYLRAKYNDNYVYSVPISVNNMKENTKFQEVEFGEKTYNVHIFQWTRNKAAFYVVDYAPEEIENLFSGVEYIKYRFTENSDRGLVVSYVDANLGSYCIVNYKYDADVYYHSDGQIYQKQYFENGKQVKLERFENGKLVQDTLKTYDELGRTYTITNRHYNENGEIFSTNGLYYTYDEECNGTMHYGFPGESTEPTEPTNPIEPIDPTE